MPKKTRQEKILAQLRRLQQQTKTQAFPEKDEKFKPVVDGSELKSLERPLSITTAPVFKSEIENYNYVIRDLKKTLVFASAAVFFELFLNLVKGYWHLF